MLADDAGKEQNPSRGARPTLESEMEPYLVGFLLAVAICGAATLTGLDRESAFYTTVLAVVASYYVLFAVMSGSRSALWPELAIGGAFLVLAFAGFSFNLWVVVAGLAGHGAFDFFHALFVENDGVPWWWPGFCLAFDVTAAIYLAALLRSRVATSSQGGHVNGVHR